MTKSQKKQYINDIYYRFLNARNHGINGSNWWTPTAGTIAYNVKLHCMSKDINDIRNEMTERQNDYYSDDALYEITSDIQCDTARMFAQELEDTHGVACGYAGRSGGWLEVAYTILFESVDDTTDTAQVNDYYKQAKELEKLESTIASAIKEAHANYCKYLNSDDYITYVIDGLLSDEDIAGIYKQRIEMIVEKLK